MKYKEGEVYYQVTYVDPAMCYPKIETFVFVGVTHSEGGQDVWCFQYTDGYAKFGSVLKNKDGDRRAFLATKSDLEEMIDRHALDSLLKAATMRRKKKNERP